MKNTKKTSEKTHVKDIKIFVDKKKKQKAEEAPRKILKSN